MVGARFFASAQNDEEKDHAENEDYGPEGHQLLGLGGHGIGFHLGAGWRGIRGIGQSEGVVSQGERGELFEFGEEFGLVLGIVLKFLFELAGNEEAGDLLEEFVGDGSAGGGDGLHIEDELAIGQKRGGDEGSVEVVVPVLDIEWAAHKFREVAGGTELVVDDSLQLFGRDLFKEKLAAEAFEDFEMGDGKIEIPGGQGDRGGALVADFGIEVAETVDEGVDVGFLILGLGDGSGFGFGFREGFVGVGLLLQAEGGRSNEDENDHGYYDENEATGKGRAGGVLLFGNVGVVGHGGMLHGRGGRLNSEL